MLQNFKQKILALQKKYEHQLEIAFFIGGFIFDAVLVSEVDDPFAICQQAVYLFFIASLLHHEMLFRLHKWKPQGRWIKLWNFRDLLLHFLLGTLLNIYSLFYIKSASLLNSLIFLVVMIGMIIANELPIVKKSKVSSKVGLFAICLFSYISIMYPLILGFVGWTPFALSLITTLAIFYFQYYLLHKKVPDEKTLFKATLMPSASVLIIFVIFYFAGWIPPVPISAKEQGVYHLVEKKEGEYWLSTEKVWWKFWQSGDQDFRAQPGDKIYFYAQIYSPARFSDDVYVQWALKDPKRGWQNSDRIPVKISGGRKEGYRGYTSKANYQAGDWRVQVLTANGQEISRLYFTVEQIPATENRTFTILHR